MQKNIVLISRDINFNNIFIRLYGVQCKISYKSIKGSKTYINSIIILIFFEHPLPSTLVPKEIITLFLLHSMRSIRIGLAPSATLKGSHVRTMETMILIKVTNCSIHLGWILSPDDFAKNYMGSRPEPKTCDIFI